jgi:uncharacterized protein (DUF2336 family)
MSQEVSLPIHVEEHRAAGEGQARIRAEIHRLMGDYEQASEAQADVLDIRLLKLLKAAAPSLRTEAAERLAGVRKCPPRSVRSLAYDPDPHVATAILRRSSIICERTLVEMALCKGQAHLEAIAARRNLTESVTRILIRRGDRLVLQTLARNRTAVIAPPCRRRLLARLGEQAPTLRRLRTRVPRPQLGAGAPA